MYVSSWLKCYYPQVFATALLNSMPMGFYQPAQIIIDAEKHGVKVLPIDINYSSWDNTLEKTSNSYALRLGFRQIKGLREDDIKLLVQKRAPLFVTMDDIRNTGVYQATLERLADADAFHSIGFDRRQALWELSVKDTPAFLFEGQAAPDAAAETKISLPRMMPSEQVVQDYAVTGFSIKAHPVGFIRQKLMALHIITTAQLPAIPDGAFIRVAGLVLVRQRPGTAGGVCFMTIEDETGFANLVIFQSLFETFRKEILKARLIMVTGRLQVEGEVIHVIVKTCHDLSPLLRDLSPKSGKVPNVQTLAFPDETSVPPGQHKRPETGEGPGEKIFGESRNFR